MLKCATTRAHICALHCTRTRSTRGCDHHPVWCSRRPDLPDQRMEAQQGVYAPSRTASLACWKSPSPSHFLTLYVSAALIAALIHPLHFTCIGSCLLVGTSAHSCVSSHSRRLGIWCHCATVCWWALCPSLLVHTSWSHGQPSLLALWAAW